MGCAGSFWPALLLQRWGLGPGHRSLRLGAPEPAAHEVPSLSCVQIWADPGKYALMGAAAQLGELLSCPPLGVMATSNLCHSEDGEKMLSASLMQFFP